jgi:hypothetical protein
MTRTLFPRRVELDMVEQVQGGPDLVGCAVHHLRKILMMLGPEPAVYFVVHDVLLYLQIAAIDGHEIGAPGGSPPTKGSTKVINWPYHRGHATHPPAQFDPRVRGRGAT